MYFVNRTLYFILLATHLSPSSSIHPLRWKNFFSSGSFFPVLFYGSSSKYSDEALRAAAILLRRLHRYEQAAARWRDLLAAPQCPPTYAREASEALAVHHEHRVRDLPTARAFAVRSLTLQASPAREHAIKHRLARLDRKLGGATSAASTPALF